MDLSKSPGAEACPRAEEEDFRVKCTNAESLDRILQITQKHVQKTAESLPPNKRSRFVERFTEVFQEIMQQNVSVSGHPWIPGDTLASPALAQQQLQESEDASKSRLAAAVEKVAARRKRVPKECGRILEMELKHSRQNLKQLEVDHPMPTPPPPRPSPSPFCHQELAQVLEEVSHEQTKIHALDADLEQLESDYQETCRILAQPMNDTGFQTP